MTDKGAKAHRKPMSKEAFEAELRRLTAELRSLERDYARTHAERPIEVVIKVVRMPKDRGQP